MGLHEEHDEFDDYSFSDHKYDDDLVNLTHKKRVKRLLDERLERKRLKEECSDDFDELSGEFNWDDWDK